MEFPLSGKVVSLRKSPWLKRHLFLLIVSASALLLLVLSVVVLAFYPYINIMLSMLISGTFLYVNLRGRAAEIRLTNQGLHTTGTVVDKKIAYGKEDELYFVTYAFKTPDGKQINSEHEVAQSLYNKLKIGNPVNISFDLADPTRSIPIGGIRPLWRIISGAVVIAGVTFLGSVFLIILFN